MGFLTRFKIGARLSIGLGLLVAFMVVLMAVGIGSMRSINEQVERIIRVNNAKIECAFNIRDAINGIDKSLLSILVSREEMTVNEEKLKIEAFRKQYKENMDRFEKLEETAKGKELIAKVKEAIGQAKDSNNRAVEAGVKGNLSEGVAIFQSVTRLASLQLNALTEEMVKYQQERTAIRFKEMQTTYRNALILFIVAGAVMLAIAGFLAVLLARSIVRPLTQGAEVANRLADGDLTAEIVVKGSDETSVLLSAMKNMVERLKATIGEVKTAAGNVASASHELSASAEQMSGGAGSQADKASQVATASEEMSQTVIDVAKNTNNIEVSATATARLAREGGEVVGRSVEEVKAIAATVDASARLIRSLGDRSAQIGDIVSVINEIADQTNLLALNAAIEAARAGEVGRGFAVVADEVKKLAERTANSTAEIGGMIRSIQDEVQEVVRSMDSITVQVSSGVELSVRTGTVLEGIVKGVEDLHGMVQQIASATEEMAATSEEISKDIDAIAMVSKETSGSADQVAQASQEMARLSTMLEGSVGAFRV